MGKSVLQYQGDHPVADEYRALARELEDRLSFLSKNPDRGEFPALEIVNA